MTAALLAIAATVPDLASAADVDLLSPTPIAAEPLWGAAVFIGASGNGHDLHELAYQPWLIRPSDHTWLGASVSRRFVRFWDDFTIDGEIGVGHRFGENRYRANEGWAAVYVRYDGFPWKERLYTTFGLSTGLNILSSLPAEETRKIDKNRSHLLHYFSPELTFALPEHRNHEFVVRYHHRSGVFGTFNGVWGGSNVLSVGYRYRW